MRELYKENKGKKYRWMKTINVESIYAVSIFVAIL